MASTALQNSDVKNYVLAGNATITLQSGLTGKHFTYKITKYKNSNVYFVKLLVDKDKYRYIGNYSKSTECFYAVKPYTNRMRCVWPPSLRAINLLFSKLDNLPNNLYCFHEGTCGKCGKKLTTPDSIKRGFGPTCYENLQGGTIWNKYKHHG